MDWYLILKCFWAAAAVCTSVLVYFLDFRSDTKTTSNNIPAFVWLLCFLAGMMWPWYWYNRIFK